VAKKATVEVKRILRRLHVPQDRAERKKKLKPFGRTMGKIGHAAPLAVMEAIVQQVWDLLLHLAEYMILHMD
jgi:hypothetical protein